MAFALDPLGDPIGFLALFLLQNLGDPFVPLKLALYSSVVIFPFVLFGRWLHSKLTARNWLKGMKLAGAFRLVTVCFAITFLFWLVTRLWYFGFHGTLSVGSAYGTLLGLLIGTVVSSVLAFIGDKLIGLMKQHWKMPSMLSVYIVELVMSAVFWIPVALLAAVSLGSAIPLS